MPAATGSAGSVPIPQPPEHLYGLLGNLPDLDPSFAARSLWHLAEIYGPIYQLNMINRKMVVVSNYELAKEVLSDDNFEKVTTGVLDTVRNVAGDGLFTAHSDERNWAKAHRLLMPIFGPMGIRKMFPDMLDISTQMIAKWDRLGPDHEIVASDDFTRMAFDTIGLCGYGFRFNEFYSEDVHPFAHQMAETLLESGKISTRTAVETKLRVFAAKQYNINIEAMHMLCKEIINDRKAHPQDERHDLLSTMMKEADPVTGEKLDEQNIIYQMVTFLIAGHETTSGTMSFLFYHFLKNPEKMLKAQEEVDNVIGSGTIELSHIPKLKYIDACIKETLRYQGPITAVQRHAKTPQLLGGKYYLTPDMPVVTSLALLHRDPAVWGDDVMDFRPERMLDMSKIPPSAWKPFGTGVRSCIGRAFAEQEMIAAVALILQRFQVEAVDPSYDLQLKSTLTIKPDNFKFKVRRRPGISPIGVQLGVTSREAKAQQTKQIPHAASDHKIQVLYGSNAGTCKAFANEVDASAPGAGFQAQVMTLDEATETLSADPVVIITASYEGKPTDNAKKFVSWLESKKGDTANLKNIRFAVFGVGNSEWVTSYHRVPKLIEELMAEQGAQKICDSVFTDVKENAIGDWEEFLASFWTTVRSLQGSTPTVGRGQTLKTKVIKSGTAGVLGGAEMTFGVVRESRELADTTVGPAKRHMEIELPRDVTYQSGDYLVVQAINPRLLVDRVLRRFDLHGDDLIQVQDTKKAYLLSDYPRNAYEFFATRVDLNNPVTQRQLAILAEATPNEAQSEALESLRIPNSHYKTEVLDKRVSVLDALEDQPACELALSEYIDMLKPLAPRQYSISSSPLAQTKESNVLTASITYDVCEAPALSGGERTFQGVCSTFLATRTPGTRMHCHIRATNISFHLPPSPKTPVIMIAAGSGMAPMRGFLQERAAIAAARGAEALGPAVFYFGCRDFEKDYIYKDELREWERQGVVSMRTAFSRRGPEAEKRFKYVPDRMWAEREELRALYRAGAKVFLCGSAGKLAKSVNEVLKKTYLEEHAVAEEEAEKWLEEIKEDRYVTDVFG